MTKQIDEPSEIAEEAYQVWKAVFPPMWLDLLLKISHAPDQRLRMSDLAESAFLTRGGVTRLVTRIETDGLLRREPCPDDGRGAFAVLTRAGADALRRAGPVYRKTLETRFAAHLTRVQARDAANALEAVLAGNGWAVSAADRTTWHSSD